MSIQSEIDRIQNNVAETYDALEEQGATMPTQKNSDNMAATARTISTSSGGTTVQADLAVNDSTNPRYVKNRTHWKEVYDGPEGEVISETSVAFTSNIKTITGAMSDAIHAGALYIVTWNGVDYRCIGKASSDGNYIGNGSFMNAGNITFEDTGEPFCVLQFGGSYYMVYKANTTAETITVKVVGKKETVWHKLDGGYLPEGVPYSEGKQTVELLPETTVEVDPDAGAALFPDVLDVAVGNTYTVKWNGTEFYCTAQYYTENGVSAACLGNLGVMTGGTDTGEPFVMMCLDAGTAAAMGAGIMCMPLDGSTSVTLSISGVAEKLRKMDGKFQTEGTPYMQPFDDVILEETVLADVLVETDVGKCYNLPIGNIIPGNIYNVEFDGVVYRTKAYRVTQGEITVVALGSGFLHEGSTTFPGVPFTGDPFTILIYPATIQQAYGFNVAISWDYGFGPEESGTQTIAIRGGYTVNKIDEHCLPEGSSPMIVTLHEGDTTQANIDYFYADKSLNEVWAALRAKIPVWVYVAFESKPSDLIFCPITAYVASNEINFGVFRGLQYYYFNWSSGNEIEMTTERLATN